MTTAHHIHISCFSKKELIDIKRVVNAFYDLGLTEVLSPAGNRVKAYDVERTLCDIVRGNNACEIQTVNQVMKQYAMSKTKDIQKLIYFAEKLRVKKRY